MNRKGSALVIVLISIAILALGTFWYIYIKNAPPTGGVLISNYVPISASSTTDHPQTPSDSLLFTDPNGSFSFSYPTNFAIVDKNEIAVGSYFQNNGIQRATTNSVSMFPGTNFGGVSLHVYSEATTTLSDCETPGRQTPSGKSTPSTHNGITWYEGIEGSAAAGTAVLYDDYTNYRANSCWHALFEWIVSSAAVGLPVDPSQPSGPTIQFLSNASMTQFEYKILDTFQF